MEGLCRDGTARIFYSNKGSAVLSTSSLRMTLCHMAHSFSSLTPTKWDFNYSLLHSLTLELKVALLSEWMPPLKTKLFEERGLAYTEWCIVSSSIPHDIHVLSKMINRKNELSFLIEVFKTHPMLITHKAMSIVLSKLAKFRSFEDTLEAFEKLEREVLVGREFGVAEFNVLIRVLCLERQMKDARVVFAKMLSRFSPNLQTFNILLLGFKESGDVMAVELFYNEMVRRGFKPNVVSFSIRIDAYCKKGSVGDGLRLVEEMERLNLMPTLEIFTTLIHGAGIARNISLARELFDEIPKRKLAPDIGAYNALMGCYVRCRDVKSGLSLMNETEENGVRLDHVSYHTLFLGLKRSHGMEGVYMVYQRMVERKFVPKMYTVVMLMKFFCENRRADLGLELWRFLVDRGCCPHEHAMDLLVTGLCCVGKMEEAYDCLIQMAERGRPPGKRAIQVLERFLVKAGKTDKLRNLNKMTNMFYAFYDLWH
ncbi:hypothetical protein Sjap_022892 [Stephania japonica]|uniref:Pentatricopeptide repeat-containing protein n=1 Tax=Stephania japonica TaxID=461633 RepID=A0AAP0HVC5_9MAGN